jgi:hypothetical protein
MKQELYLCHDCNEILGVLLDNDFSPKLLVGNIMIKLSNQKIEMTCLYCGHMNIWEHKFAQYAGEKDLERRN